MPLSQDRKKGDQQVIDWGRANNLTVSFIQDNAKRWSEGQWQGHYVRIRGGLNDCAVRVIQDSSENRLMLQKPLPVPPHHSDESSYEILALQADPARVVAERLTQMETQISETNLVLRQIRDGISSLIERDLSATFPET